MMAPPAAVGRSPWVPNRTLGLVALVLAVAGAVAAIAAVEGQCEAGKGNANCPGVPSQLPETTPEAATAGDSAIEVLATNAVTVSGVNHTEHAPHAEEMEFGTLRVGFVLALLVFVTLWIAGTIKFACDGSLPARLALWGLLPEAYAAISVRAVAALLRLKQGTTPVVVLRNCVSDDGALELAEAVRRYGKKADLQALELPHNPALSQAGLRHLTALALEEGRFPLQELDISYNPQLGDAAGEHLLPLLKPKASQVNTLRLADCSLSVGFLQRFAEKASLSSLRMLDLSFNNLSGAGEVLVTLCEAPVLEELTLACCGLSIADIEALAEQLPYTSLRSLHLGGNGFGGRGLAALAATLPQSRVDELGLEKNDLVFNDLSCLGQAWAARPFSRLRLDGNRMAQSEVAQFIRTLRSIHS